MLCVGSGDGSDRHSVQQRVQQECESGIHNPDVGDHRVLIGVLFAARQQRMEVLRE